MGTRTYTKNLRTASGHSQIATASQLQAFVDIIVFQAMRLQWSE
jgi:hypothetical protein